MKAMLKTAALAATLGLGAVGSASAATLFTFGEGATTGTFSATAGQYTVTISDNATAFYALNTLDLGFVDSGSFSTSFVYDYAGPDMELSYYIFVSPGGEVTVTGPEDQTPVVPLPASLPLLAGALGVAGLATRRRKAK